MTDNIMLNKLNSLIKNIFRWPGDSAGNHTAQHESDSNIGMNMRQKEINVYGSDRITQQKLYEKWAVKNSWHLKDQAIPLLLSMDPEIFENLMHDETSKKKYDDLWLHAQHCVEQGLLAVNNRTSAAIDWKAAPVDVYKWAAISRVQLPEQLTFLMEFVLKSLMPVNDEKPTGSSAQNESTYDKGKESILGAALAMLVAYPERCMNKKGRVRSENILLLINENESVLFDDDLPDLSSTASLDIINQWLNKITRKTEY